MAQQGHKWHHAQICLTIVGIDGQEKDGVGMKMQRMQPVVAKDLVEEVRKGGTSPTAMLLVKKGKKVLPSGSGASEATRSSVFPLPLLFSETLGTSRAGSYQAGDEEG